MKLGLLWLILAQLNLMSGQRSMATVCSIAALANMTACVLKKWIKS